MQNTLRQPVTPTTTLFPPFRKAKEPDYRLLETLLPDNHYAQIGIPLFATRCKILERQRQIRIISHPDTSGFNGTTQENAEERFKVFETKFEILCHPPARLFYDIKLVCDWLDLDNHILPIDEMVVAAVSWDPTQLQEAKRIDLTTLYNSLQSIHLPLRVIPYQNRFQLDCTNHQTMAIFQQIFSILSELSQLGKNDELFPNLTTLMYIVLENILGEIMKFRKLFQLCPLNELALAISQKMQVDSQLATLSLDIQDIIKSYDQYYILITRLYLMQFFVFIEAFIDNFYSLKNKDFSKQPAGLTSSLAEEFKLNQIQRFYHLVSEYEKKFQNSNSKFQSLGFNNKSLDLFPNFQEKLITFFPSEN